jgi:predicted transcriptional regulator
MHFTLEGATTDRLIDTKGNRIWSVFAKPANEQDQEEVSKKLETDFIKIMAAILKNSNISQAGLAQALCWRNEQGQLNRSKVQRRVEALEKKKLIERDGEHLELTVKGKKWLARRQTAAPAASGGMRCSS